MTIKPIKEVKKKRSTKPILKEPEKQDDQFQENNEDTEIDQNRLNDVVFPYHIKTKRNVLKKTSATKGSGGNSPRPHVHKQNTLNNDDILKSGDPVSPTKSCLASEDQEECSGYNSGDEHAPVQEEIDWKKRDADFEQLLKQKGLILKQVAEDGACLFRAISIQIYGDEGMHEVVRKMTMDYIQKNRDYYSAFMTENIDDYIKRKRDVKSHGNHIELQAISEVFNRPIELYAYEAKPINIFNSDQLKNGYPPLRLSYQRNNHYNAITDPYDATVGIGLGLPELNPTLQTTEAMKLSEELEIEKTMLEDKIKTADWEATNEAIQEQIARESYLEWLQQTLKKKKNSECTVTATVTSYTQVKPTIGSAFIPSSTASDPAPSTSQGKVATESNTITMSSSDETENSQKKFVKLKYGQPGKNIDDFEAKRLCNFDIRSSDEDISIQNSTEQANVSAVDDHLPSTSKQSSPNVSIKTTTPISSPEKSSSNLYEELLQASLAFGEYNESEMFQRVLQMSTEDYLLQQNRNSSNLM